MPRHLDIINRYYARYPVAREFLIGHSTAVAKKSLDIARRLGSVSKVERHRHLDMEFIEEAAMLHDIGMVLTHAPGIGCSGEKPYICHGWLGSRLLGAEGMSRHALVCLRHVGTGLTVEDIQRNGFPLPQMEMIPVSIEERIICYADKFYSKGKGRLKENPLQEIRAKIAGYGAGKLEIFDMWTAEFGI